MKPKITEGFSSSPAFEQTKNISICSKFSLFDVESWKFCRKTNIKCAPSRVERKLIKENFELLQDMMRKSIIPYIHGELTRRGKTSAGKSQQFSFEEKVPYCRNEIAFHICFIIIWCSDQVRNIELHFSIHWLLPSLLSIERYTSE